MLIIEGVRKSGKSYTTNLLSKFPHFLIYKDLGMRLIPGTKVDPDDYAIGRDFAYAQSLPSIADEYLFKNNLVFDRGYWSSYVYGQAWRDKYDKDFWKNHIIKIEETWGETLNEIQVVLITLTEDDFVRIENMNRSKDVWDSTSDFRKQYELYQEILNVTTLSKNNIHFLPAFQSDEFIKDFFNKILQR